MPVLYSGDEIGQLNDYTYHDDPVKCEDSRYIHRGNFNWDEAALRHDETTRQGKLFQTIKKLENIRKEYPLFECDADAWTLETYNDKILGIGRYYEGEKLLAFFNFSEEDETAWINEEENYIDLVTGQPRAAKAVGVPAHDFVWLYYNFNPKPEVKVEEVKAEEPAAPAEEVKAEAAPVEEVKAEAAPVEEVKAEAAPVEEVKAEEPAAPVEEAPKKTTRKRTTKKAAAPAAEEAPKKTTKKRTTKKAAAADAPAEAAPAAEEAPKKTTRKRTTKKAAAADAPAAEEAPKKTTRKRATKKAAKTEE
jgi:amylosucrase